MFENHPKQPATGENSALRANTPSGVKSIGEVDQALNESVDAAFAEFEEGLDTSGPGNDLEDREFDPIAEKRRVQSAEALARDKRLAKLPKMQEPEAEPGEEIDPNFSKDLRFKLVANDIRQEKFARDYQDAKKAGNADQFHKIDPDQAVDPSETLPHFPGSPAYAAEQARLAEERAKTIQEAIKRYPSAQAEYNKKRAEGPKLPHFPGSKAYIEEQARLNPATPEVEELDDAYLAENMVEVLPGEENERAIYPSDLESDDVKKAA